VTKEEQIAKIVDELGVLNERLTPDQMQISADIERAEILENQLRSELRELPPDMPAIITANNYGCKVGAMKNMTTIVSMLAAAKAVKAAGKKLYEHFKITLGDLQKIVSPAKFEELTKTKRTGPRALETYRLNPK
jgi:hypothetical protein